MKDQMMQSYLKNVNKYMFYLLIAAIVTLIALLQLGLIKSVLPLIICVAGTVITGVTIFVLRNVILSKYLLCFTMLSILIAPTG